jgi:hypothetical protein
MIAAIEKLEATEISEIAEKYRQQCDRVLVRPRNYNWQKFIQNQEINLAIYTIQESVIAALKPPYKVMSNPSFSTIISQEWERGIGGESKTDLHPLLLGGVKVGFSVPTKKHFFTGI